MKLIAILALTLSLTQVCAGETFKTICDFDKVSRPWVGEAGPVSNVRQTTLKAHSGKGSLVIDVVPGWGSYLRATWGTDLENIALTPETKIRFFMLASPPAKIAKGQPHSVLVLIEAGGGENGRDSHWILDIPSKFYAGGGWKQCDLGPVSKATNANWAPDADGKLDCDRISGLLFVVQRDDPTRAMPIFTVYLDDFAATDWTTREPRISPAENNSIPDHIRPVQRGFVGRKRDAGQTITFSDVSGWNVVQYGQSQASFVRSQEEPLFGEPVGKLTYKSSGRLGYIRLEPPKPITLSKFNGMLMWVYGNNWDWVPDAGTPRVLISVELVDPSGEKHLIDLDRVNWKFWSMMHKCVVADSRKDERHAAYGGDRDGKLEFPAKLTAIEVRGGSNTDYRSLYLDSLIFREEKPNLPKFEAKLDNLPFPTTPDTILPSLSDAKVENSVTQTGKTFHFIAKSPAETVEYVYTPKTGTLSDLTALVGNQKFKPCDGGGVIVDEVLVTWNLVSATLAPDKSVRTAWKCKNGADFELAVRIKGKSLICDWTSKGRRATDLELGHATGLRKARVINVPYLSMGWNTPPGVVLSDGIYCFTLLDWYNTNASDFFGGSQKISDSEAVCNGGSRYYPASDGRKNPLRERQFITVSSTFEEVLPNIPNPPSPMKDITGTNLYLHMGGTGIDRFDKWLATWRTYKEYGIDHVRLSQHEDAWTDGADVGQGPQEFTMTLDAAPEIGDAKLIEYCTEVRKLGWLIGLYSNYTDYSMLGKSWDERNVTKSPNLEWRRAWPPCFNIKPLKAVDMEAYYAPKIAEKFGTNTVYCDVHTSLPPWANVDYEAGTPGAAMMATTFKAYGALLLNERKSYGGPVFSEGTHHWFYAGLDDGNYAQMGLENTDTPPLLLDFDLRKIHPLQANVSMSPSWTLGDGQYHAMALAIAYGHIGFLPSEDVTTAARGYYMMQQLQTRYTQVPVEQIMYRAADGRMLEISKALPAVANEESQAYVKYQNGLEIYVNCNKDANKSWKFITNGQVYDVSPFGWVALAQGLTEFSTDINGRRVNYADSPIYTYVDAADQAFDFGAVETAGSLVIRKDDPRGLKVIPIAGVNSARLSGAMSKVTAYSADGKDLGPAKFQVEGTKTTIEFSADARYYIAQQ